MSDERIPGRPADTVQTPEGIVRGGDVRNAQVIGYDTNPPVLGIDRNPPVRVGDDGSSDRSLTAARDAARYHLRGEELATFTEAEAAAAARAARDALGIGSSVGNLAAHDAQYAQAATDAYYSTLHVPAQEQANASFEPPAQAGQQASNRVVLPPVKPRGQHERQPVVGRWTQFVAGVIGGRGAGQGHADRIRNGQGREQGEGNSR